MEGRKAKLLISVTEAAEILGIGRNRAYQWIHAGIIPAVRSGGRIYIARKAIDALVEQIAEGELPIPEGRK